MSSIFLAIPQYKKIPEAEVARLKGELKLNEWVTRMKGFHPMFDVSITNLLNTGRHKIGMCHVYGDGNLPRVRSFQLGLWKRAWDTDNKCDYFMIVDEDISFDPEAIDILIKDDKPIVGGIYTFKTTNPHYTGKVCTRFLDNQPGDLSGPFRVRWLNGGFILVKAEVLLAMIDRYKDLAFNVGEDSSMDMKESWALWCPFVHDRVFLSEDWAFCQRAQDMGFEVWADWRAKLVHWNGENGFGISI
jgi:hypothetical protein